MNKAGGFLFSIVGLTIGCTQRDPGQAGIEVRQSELTSPAITFNLALQTPAGMSPTAVTIGATRSVSIGGATKITRSGTALSTVTNMGSNGVQAQPDAVLGDVWSTSNVDLRDRVHVLGTVHAPSVTQGNSVRIDKGIDRTTPLTPATITSWKVTYPAATVVNVTLQPGQSISEQPARYGAVSIASSATLTLSTGSYFLDSLDLEPGGQIKLNQDNGPVIIYARNSLIFRGKVVSATSGVSPDVLLGYLGTSGIFIESSFTGTIVAPSAALTLRAVTGGHTGAFFGQSVSVDPNTTVTFRPGQVILTVSPPGVAGCAAAIVPSDTLTGRAQMIQYQQDITRYCTRFDLGNCEATLRARVKVDYYTSAVQVVAGTRAPELHFALIHDRERKMHAIRGNETLACQIVKADTDQDFVTNSQDACANTPLLTATFDNGCTDSSTPDGSHLKNLDWSRFRIAIAGDPRCKNAPQPHPPEPLGAWRFPPDPTVGKAVWFSASNDTSGCPIFYDVEVELTDGQGVRQVTFNVPQDDRNVTWIPRPAGIFQVNLHTSDAGNAGAWASYSVWTRQYRVRAFNAAGMISIWSQWYSPGFESCVAGACGDF